MSESGTAVMNSHADAKSWRDSTAIALGFALFVLHSFADLTSTQALSSALQGVSLAFGGMAIASAWQQRFRWLAGSSRSSRSGSP